MGLPSTQIAEAAGAAMARVGTTAYLITASPPDPADPFGLPGLPTRTAMDVVYMGWSERDIDGTLITQGDRKVLVSVPSLGGQVPRLADGFAETADGPRLEIVPPLKTLAPAGQALYYVLNVRG